MNDDEKDDRAFAEAVEAANSPVAKLLAAKDATIADLRAQLQDLTAQLTDIQSNCDHELKLVDDSFDHELGVEIIRFLRCEKCGVTKPEEDVDDHDDPPEREDDR